MVCRHAHGPDGGWRAAARLGYAAGEDEGLPKIGPAPELSLTTQVASDSSSRSYAGSCVVLTFISLPTDTCPL